MISYQKAKNILNKSFIKIGDEFVHSKNCLNRVTASDVFCDVNYPAGDNAALDGFAINFKDTLKLNKKNFKKFKIVGSMRAGDKPINKKVHKFEAIEIMTGAIIPKGLNSIIPIEETNFLSNRKQSKYIFINKKIKKYQNVRFLGTDYKKKDLVIRKGTILQPNHILALRTLGIEKIKVKKKPNILFFSTGNEISNVKNIPNWKVRNSNSHYIKAFENNSFFNFVNGGILKDHQSELFKKKISKLINSNIDMIITSGAISAGKFDFIPNVVKTFKLSKFFSGVAIRPGKPILFAKLLNKNKIIFGLPGNPLSTAACYRFFIHPYLMSSLGANPEKPIQGVLKNKFTKKRHLTRFIKAKLIKTNSGKLVVEILKGQESFKIKSFVNSNVWAFFPEGKTIFKKGEVIDCYFNNFLNTHLI